MGILPAISLQDSGESSGLNLQIPKALRAPYAAIAVSKGGGIVKLLTFPAHTGKSNDDHVLELMGLGEDVYRLGYECIFENRNEVRVLASALPDTVARKICRLFSVGLPAPCSIEISGLASLTAFGHARGNANEVDCSVVVDFGAEVTLVAFFNKGILSLVRKFDFGTTHILKQLQKSLGVDQDVALGILNDGSFDVTKVVHNAMEPFLQQLIISWDFVERRENAHISKFYVCGGGVGIQLWVQELELATGQVPVKWDPFAGLPVYPKSIPDELKGQESRFASAVGAALAMMKVG
ncbi:MAG: pilus assembly protein PilM [bacterium]